MALRASQKSEVRSQKSAMTKFQSLGAMQRSLGEAVRSWGGSAVLGVSPMSDCRGSPHERLHQ